MRFIAILFSLFCSCLLNGQNRNVQADSKIRQVIVFVQGAQVERMSRVSVSAGRTDIIFSNISPQLEKQSIQVKVDEGITVLAVNHQVNFLKDQENREEIRLLEEKLQEITDKSELEKSMIQVYKQEEVMLQKNQQIGGNNGLKTTDLKEALDYQQQKFTELLQKELESGKKIKSLEKEIARLRQQLTEINQRKDRNTSEIIVQVLAGKAQESEMAISYLIKNAGWTPTYDIRVKNVSSPIKIVHKANIVQQSGEDWKDIKLILSTGNPQEKGTKPELLPWIMSYVSPPLLIRGLTSTYAPSANLSEVVVTGYAAGVDINDLLNGRKETKAKQYALPTSVSYQPITTQYEIMLPYSIPNDGKVYTTEVQNFEVPALFEYYSAPKKDPGVFLTASITDWEDLNLMSGETSLFFEGAFLGKSFLDLSAASDTLSISLGQDKSITVNRKLIRDFSEKKFLGNNKVDSRFYEIMVRNNKQEKINLTLVDQFPISGDKEIQVEQGDTKGGKIDEKTGNITWNLSLNAKEEIIRPLSYKVKYPKDRKLQW